VTPVVIAICLGALVGRWTLGVRLELPLPRKS